MITTHKHPENRTKTSWTTGWKKDNPIQFWEQFGDFLSFGPFFWLPQKTGSETERPCHSCWGKVLGPPRDLRGNGPDVELLWASNIPGRGLCRRRPPSGPAHLQTMQLLWAVDGHFLPKDSPTRRGVRTKTPATRHPEGAMWWVVIWSWKIRKWTCQVSISIWASWTKTPQIILEAPEVDQHVYLDTFILDPLVTTKAHLVLWWWWWWWRWWKDLSFVVAAGVRWMAGSSLPLTPFPPDRPEHDQEIGKHRWHLENKLNEILIPLASALITWSHWAGKKAMGTLSLENRHPSNGSRKFTIYESRPWGYITAW